MINYRVDNMDALVKKLKANKVVLCDTVQSDDYGKFLHILDCDSNKVELWQPVTVTEANMYKGKTTK
jgi:predicted enzyme related to lactoylglutathione lyase